ncbi:MAG: hypothetical protein GY927_14445 [bacterium]|nr:hypothetical protein [bacterium]
MSSRKQQQEMGKGGALVLAYSSAGVRQPDRSNLSERSTSPKAPENRVNVAARSVFLTQLASQYESKSAASVRRMEARASASGCYGDKTPKPALRHLVWA